MHPCLAVIFSNTSNHARASVQSGYKIDLFHSLYQPGHSLSTIQASFRLSRLSFPVLASVHPAQIGHSIGLSLTGSLDLLREALSLLILDLTLGRTTNKSFPQGTQCTIIHTDLLWLQFSFIFSQAEEKKLTQP